MTNAPPLLFSDTRILVAGTLLLAFVRAKEGKLNTELLRNPLLHLTSSMIIAPTFELIYWAEQVVSSGLRV